jgi:hypothetical protein
MKGCSHHSYKSSEVNDRTDFRTSDSEELQEMPPKPGKINWRLTLGQRGYHLFF